MGQVLVEVCPQSDHNSRRTILGLGGVKQVIDKGLPLSFIPALGEQLFELVDHQQNRGVTYLRNGAAEVQVQAPGVCAQVVNQIGYSGDRPFPPCQADCQRF